MKVRFKTNLGSRDAVKFGLNHRDCTIDSEHEFSDELAESLLRTGAVSVCESKPKASSRVKTVPEPVQTAPKEVEVKAKDDKGE